MALFLSYCLWDISSKTVDYTTGKWISERQNKNTLPNSPQIARFHLKLVYYQNEKQELYLYRKNTIQPPHGVSIQRIWHKTITINITHIFYGAGVIYAIHVEMYKCNSTSMRGRRMTMATYSPAHPSNHLHNGDSYFPKA